MLWQLLRIVAVLMLLIAAALLATPPGRLPLALRGLQRLLQKDAELPTEQERGATASTGRRLMAFLCVLAAAVLCGI